MVESVVANEPPPTDVDRDDADEREPALLPMSAAELPVTDIGLAVDNRSLTDAERLRLLENLWVAPPGFQWPFSERMDHGKTRRKYLGPQHFIDKYACFRYSASKQGVFCAPCVLFAAQCAGGVKLERLVKSPLQKYSHLTGENGYLTMHLQNTFHEDCVTKAQAFTQLRRSQTGDVVQQLGSAAALQREKNRRGLERIIVAIEFHGRLGLPLRGHRDSGDLPLPETKGDIDYTQGNLRATLQLMADCNDEALKQHLITTGRNSTYISPGSQNQIIAAICAVVRRQVVTEVKAARYFSIMADETTDFSHQEQLAVCVRYVQREAVFERFLCFELAPDLTGKGLAAQLLSVLDAAGLDKNDLVGQGYDGAAAMSGQHNGVQKHILDECSTAVYVHCASHALNLCLAKASEVPDIRAAITTMHEVAVFYSDSNKRLLHLQRFVDTKCPDTSRSRLKLHCTTRWVEKQDAVVVFRELFPAVVASLDDMSVWPGDTGSKATSFIKSMDSGFLVAMEILHTVLEVGII